MNKVVTIENPELLDLFFSQLQKGLTENLGWLDHAFGRAERLVKYDANNRKVFSPNVYVGGNEYKEVTPDSRLGNFSFFVVPDPQEVESVPSQYITIVADFALVVWVDFRTIFNDTNTRNKESVKRQILNLLNGGITLQKGSLKINRVYELAENIYKGFSLDEIDNQFLMHPYGGFRFEGELRIEENCPL